MLPANRQSPMRTVSARRSAAHRHRAVAVRERSLEEDDVRDARERHVFERSVDPNAVDLAMRDEGCCAPRVRSLPALARISERFLIVRSSIARWNLAKLRSGSGTHCRTQIG